MDDRQFDRLVRVLGTDRSRRGLVRALVGAVALLPAARFDEAAATAYSVPLGRSCVRDHQCSQALPHIPGNRAHFDPNAQTVICHYNGYGHDGGINCCRQTGGVCTRDAHCCGQRQCYRYYCRL